MKNKFVQLAALLVVGVGVVFGVTFTSQFTGSGGKEKEKQEKKEPEPPIRFDLSVADAHRPGGPECELHMPYVYDFWFENVNSRPVKIGVRDTTCKCTKVEVGSLPKEWKSKIVAKLVGRAAAYFQQTALMVAPAAVERELARRPSDVPVQWQLIKDKLTGVNQ